MRAGVAGLLLGAAAALGCAQPGTPPGGEPDRSPPRVVEVVPAAFDTLTDPDARVVIRFDERISERLEGVSEWEEAVYVSPATSPHRVEAGRRRVEVWLVGGWQPDRVYRVVVRPVFRDLFENRRTEPVDLVFSTGAPIPDAAIGGFVLDRLTGRAVADARVEAVRRIDGIPYLAVTDTAGFFALPFMPAGAYDVRAWSDRDRNRAMDLFEIQDSVAVTVAVADTAVTELALLRPDTTPARLARAEAIDSVTVRLVFDDYFAAAPVEGEARLYTLPDSALIGTALLFHPSRADSILAAARVAEEEPDVPDPNEAAEAAEMAEVAEMAEAGDEGADAREVAVEPAQGRGRLPSQELILYAPGLLRPDASYYVRVQGLVNIQGVAGGGGTSAFQMPPRPTPESPAPPDTVPGDTVPGDTVPGDTVPAPGGPREEGVYR